MVYFSCGTVPEVLGELPDTINRIKCKVIPLYKPEKCLEDLTCVESPSEFHFRVLSNSVISCLGISLFFSRIVFEFLGSNKVVYYL